MSKKVLACLALALAGLAAFVASRPSTLRVERSILVAAPADVAYALVEDFHRWGEWSPWDKLDPDRKRTYEGARSGVGAGFAWAGNDAVGTGRMTITDARHAQSVRIRLELTAPSADTGTTTFTFEPRGAETTVTWAMESERSFLEKAYGLFVDLDALLGRSLEDGLATLEGVAEADARTRAEAEAARALSGEAPEEDAGEPTAATGSP